jgi:hypothetical protein
MKEGLIILPPEYRETSTPIIFLAGPIQGAPDWQAEAMEIIHRINPCAVIASPRRIVKPVDFNFDVQVDWESHFLNEAGKKGVILFWLAKEKEVVPGRSYAQTSREELFEWKERHITRNAKLVIGIEEGFTGDRYIKKRFAEDCPDIKIHDTLEDTCKDVLSQL